MRLKNATFTRLKSLGFTIRCSQNKIPATTTSPANAIGRFCHTCGAHRPEKNAVVTTSAGRATRDFVAGAFSWLQSAVVEVYKRLKFPAWLRYLHFHEIKNWIGLPTPSLVAFMIGLGCIVGAVGVSLFYRASNLAEFQAIQMWRIEWLLAATASFVAGILLKRPSSNDPD